MTQLGTARVLDRLAQLSVRRDIPTLGDRLVALDAWVRDDLATLERDLETIRVDATPARMIHRAAHHLLDLKGKHLRPTCVALASRFGDGFTPRARSLAVAVELVHSATLLHDDVVDVAERRRGQPTACVVYGNAASIFAGDWLLVAALRRIAAADVPGLLDHMLAVIDEMIAAESIQLERRGQLAGRGDSGRTGGRDSGRAGGRDSGRAGGRDSGRAGGRDDYFAIAEGKTAALFRWAMVAGARAAELPSASEAALDRFGLHLGVAFQAVDDELDFATSDNTGKDPLADLREGKLTFPLVVAIERQPQLATAIEQLLADPSPPRSALAELATSVRATGALTATRALAEERVQCALAELELLPAGPAREALVTVALASLERAS